MNTIDSVYSSGSDIIIISGDEDGVQTDLVLNMESAAKLLDKLTEIAADMAEAIAEG